MNKRDLRSKRKARIRAKITGTLARPRLSVYRSNRNLSAQLIDDAKHVTLIAESVKGTKKTVGKTLGAILAKKAQEKGIKTAVFDRSGYKYHGTVKEVAEGAREGGLII